MADTDLDILQQPKPDVVDVAATVDVLRQVGVIETQAEYVSIATAWSAIRAKKDAIVAWFKPRKAKAREVYEQMLADEGTLVDPLDEALAHATKLMDAFTKEQRRRQLVDSAKSQVVAVQEETSRVLEEAQALSDAGQALNDPELQFQAHEMLERAARPGGIVPPARRDAPTPVVAGMRTRDVWDPVLTNKGEALAFVASHPEYWELFDMNESFGKNLAKLYMARLGSVIPGMSAEVRTVPVKARK